MKNLISIIIFTFAIPAFAQQASEHCVDCTTRNNTHGQVSMSGTNARDLSNVGRAIASTAKVPKEILEEICESMEYRDFPNVLVILKEEGFELDKVYDQLVCKRSIPTLMHFVVDQPAKYGVTVYGMIGFFDQLKLDNTSFDYKKILNITFTAEHDGVTHTTTVLDRINNRIPDLNSDSKRKLEGFKKSLIKRGALTAAQLNSGSNA